jgi:3'-5' exoribonuclease
MKEQFVADLAPDQKVASLFLIAEKSVRRGKSGDYLALVLADRSGRVDARVWQASELAQAAAVADTVVWVEGRTELYRDRLQVIVNSLRPAAAADKVAPADFFAHTQQDVGKLFAELETVVAGMKNPWLRRLLESFLKDPKLGEKFRRAPAAMTMHHAYLGGLLEHVVSLCGLVTAVCSHYPELDRDLLLTAAVLHDIGKTEELSYSGAISYTTRGQLLGHIVIGLEMVTKRIEAIEGFPPPLRLAVEHFIVSHHGRYEFGSPKLPAFREAVVFHYLDDLDSKLAAIRASLGDARGEGDWTERNPALERRLLRLEEFLATAAPAAPADEAAPTAATKRRAAAQLPFDPGDSGGPGSPGGKD